MKTIERKEKTYVFQTIDQDGAIETYKVDAYTLKEARKYKSNVIGNSRCGERAYGHMYVEK